jgi:diaminohydroxyphosphoribosylaminopyrimidine deaminase / 5-amino-6-(5-phosphoribosylamino)uracil reductase
MAEANDSIDRHWMQEAITLAKRGEGLVEPNPMVGCVLVRDNQLVGTGFHQRFGGPHAEVEAIASAGGEARSATAYVTLEPCCHTGKTPPCTEALIAAGISRVVVGTIDPNPIVAGQGVEQLQGAGIRVDVSVCQSECRDLIAPFSKLVTEKTPWVIAKWAMSLDGKIATKTGDSKWISSPASRELVHQLRSRMDAIMVGSGTVQADDPMLTARDVELKRTATRVVVDSKLSISPTSQLVVSANSIPVIIATDADADPEKKQRLVDCGCEIWEHSPTKRADRLPALLSELASRSMTNVLVEGGGGLLGTMFDQKLIDEVHCFVSPMLIGGVSAPGPVGGEGIDKIRESISLVKVETQNVGTDVYISGRIQR